MSMEHLRTFAGHPEVNGFVSDPAVAEGIIDELQRPDVDSSGARFYDPAEYDPEAIEFLQALDARVDALKKELDFSTRQPSWRQETEETGVHAKATLSQIQKIELPKDGDLSHVITPADRSERLAAWWQKTKIEAKEELRQSGQAWREMLHFMKHEGLMVPEGESAGDYLASMIPAIEEGLLHGTAATIETLESIRDQMGERIRDYLHRHPELAPRFNEAIAKVVLVSILTASVTGPAPDRKSDERAPLLPSDTIEMVRASDSTIVTLPALERQDQDPVQSAHDAADAIGRDSSEVRVEGADLKLPQDITPNEAAIAAIAASAPDRHSPTIAEADITSEAEETPNVTADAPSNNTEAVEVSPEVQAVNNALAEIKLGQNNNLDTLVQAVVNMYAAYAPHDKDRLPTLPEGYVKMMLPHEAVGISVPYTVGQRTADIERYVSPETFAVFLAAAQTYQLEVNENYPQHKGSMLRMRDGNGPAHNTHNNGDSFDFSSAYGYEVEQYADGPFGDYLFSDKFDKQFTEDILSDMSTFYINGERAIYRIYFSGDTVVPNVNGRVGGDLFMKDIDDNHKDHPHVKTKHSLANFKPSASQFLPWSADQDLWIGGQALDISQEQHASQHADFEEWIAEQDSQLSSVSNPDHPQTPSRSNESDPEETRADIIEAEPLSEEAAAMIDQLSLTQAQKDFLRRMLPSITSVYRTGARINPAVVLAQTTLETGFGHDRLSPATNNYFGMKAGANWTGDVYNIDTKEEYQAGNVVTITDGFRVYNSPAESVADYASLVESSAHYADAAANYKSKEGYVNGLFNEVDAAGNIVKEQGEPGVLSYGTDRGYEGKVLHVIEKYGYEELVKVQLGGQIAKTQSENPVTSTAVPPETGERVVFDLESLPRERVAHIYSHYFVENGELNQDKLNEWLDMLPTVEINGQVRYRFGLDYIPGEYKGEK